MSTRKLKIDHSRSAADLPAFAAAIGATGWLILQTYPELIFRAWSPGDPIPELGSEFAGRVFGPDAEVRWIREAGHFEMWRYSESADGQEFDVTPRNYYGLGYWEQNRFWEPVLPKPIEYPMPPGFTPQPEDRPLFQVLEYRRRPPSAWPTDIEQLEDLLNQPALAAYRITGFTFGQDAPATRLQEEPDVA